MKKLFLLSVLVGIVIFILTSLAASQDKVKATYVGDKSCKMCHKAEFDAWAATGHAKAYTALKPEEQKKAECAGCHITGKTAADSLITNITCEACHGPGSEYKKPTIMSKTKWTTDQAGAKKAAISAGLIYPTAENCMKCHKKEGNPNYKEFNFEKMKVLIHPVKK
jgi:hypothetical protein